ncbi:hypothetical protein Tco_0039988 [Tanacetum coccineum]
MVPIAVQIKSGLVSVNTARQVNAAHIKTIVNAARSMSYLSKIAHSTVKRPIHKNTTFKNSNFNQRVNIVKVKNVNTVRPKAVVSATRPKEVVNVVKGNNVNDVKASAYWVWKPKTKFLDHVNKARGAQIHWGSLFGKSHNALGYSTFRCNPDLGVLQIGTRAKVIENQSCLLRHLRLPTLPFTLTLSPVEPSGEDDEEVSEGGIPRVIILGYDGLPMQPVAPPSPDYIPGLEDL